MNTHYIQVIKFQIRFNVQYVRVYEFARGPNGALSCHLFKLLDDHGFNAYILIVSAADRATPRRYWVRSRRVTLGQGRQLLLFRQHTINTGNSN